MTDSSSNNSAAGPLVSVVIPTYNRPKYLENAIRSVLNQTYPNLEIIVVDDASDLGYEPLKEKYSSVTFMKNDENRGACYSRNRGLEAANGEFINFLDDDDELFPEKIRLQIQQFQQSDDPNLGMVTCHLVDERSGKPVEVRNRVRGNIYRRILARYAVSGTETMLFKKELVVKAGGFDDHLPANHEYDLLIRISESAAVDYVDEVLSKKNRSVNQININFDKKITGAKMLYNKHKNRFRNQGVLFWITISLKYRLLHVRFLIGKLFGEKVYRILLRD